MGVTGLLPEWFGRLVAWLPDPVTVLVAVAVGVLAIAILRRLYRRLGATGD